MVGTSGLKTADFKGWARGGDVRLYHVDGTLVHTFEGHTGHVEAVAVTHDGQPITSSSPHSAQEPTSRRL